MILSAVKLKKNQGYSAYENENLWCLISAATWNTRNKDAMIFHNLESKLPVKMQVGKTFSDVRELQRCSSSALLWGLYSTKHEGATESKSSERKLLLTEQA